MDTIRIFVTGGTIDGINTDTGTSSEETIVPDLLKQGRVTVKHETEVLMMKDSRDLNDSDRDLIIEKCRSCAERSIVITCGTMTMSELAKAISAENIDKTIILTGAMIPANEPNSDALFNFGSAIIACQQIPVGVYVVMNGRVFDADNVRKNIEKGEFKELTLK